MHVEEGHLVGCYVVDVWRVEFGGVPRPRLCEVLGKFLGLGCAVLVCYRVYGEFNKVVFACGRGGGTTRGAGVGRGGGAVDGVR